MKQIIMILIMGIASFCDAQDIPDDRLQRIYEATVRVKCNGGIGTGTLLFGEVQGANNFTSPASDFNITLLIDLNSNNIRLWGLNS